MRDGKFVQAVDTWHRMGGEDMRGKVLSRETDLNATTSSMAL